MLIRISRICSNPLPVYMTEGAAGCDLSAALDRPVVIPRGQWRLIPCGFRIAIPKGFEGQVRPRSGLSAREGVTVLNSPGTIDSDYRGEVKVCLVNFDVKDWEVKPFDRIAQLVICPIIQAEWQEVDDLDETVRGENGYGSTGLGSDV